MAYDEALAGRVRTILSGRPGYSERTLFGGPSFFLNGNMVCSVNSQGFTLSAGEKGADLLAMPNMKPKMLGAKQIMSMAVAEPAAYESDDALKMMLNMAADEIAKKPEKLQPAK